MDGSRLRDVRKDNGDTQETLGKKLNVATPTVSKWEQGLTEPSFDILKQICRMYQVSADYLLGLSDDDPILNKKRQTKLSGESRAVLRRFEEFLIFQDSKRKE
ncbi:MAG: helix-turn-helix transcriptional regulator [Clostridia bacterium]|nr:helix-turn-helix transcriptional regulator [Clostridia bacterium]